MSKLTWTKQEENENTWYSCFFDNHQNQEITLCHINENRYLIRYYSDDTVPCLKKYIEAPTLDDAKETALNLIDAFLSDTIQTYENLMSLCKRLRTELAENRSTNE